MEGEPKEPPNAVLIKLLGALRQTSFLLNPIKELFRWLWESAFGVQGVSDRRSSVGEGLAVWQFIRVIVVRRGLKKESHKRVDNERDK